MKKLATTTNSTKL